MISISLPAEAQELLPIMQELLRRVPDETVVPFFVDRTNQRVLIGATAASSANQGKLEVTGDIKILGSANGIVLPDSGNSGRTYRLTIVEVNDEAGIPSPVLSIVRVD